MGEIIDLFTRERYDMTPEHRAHLIQRVTDLAIEIALLESEKKRLETVLNKSD